MADVSFKVFQIPVLTDNYIYILRDEEAKLTAVIDPTLAEPVNHFLEEKNWHLNFIFNTHHHIDHIGGNHGLKNKWNPEVIGFLKDTHRIPGVTKTVKEGEKLKLGKHLFEVLFLPGHTLGHIAYFFPKQKWLFCGDVLFAMGCGRLFEGSPKQMFHSLSMVKKLPPDTLIYCAHEYTEANGRFALSVDPNNAFLKARMNKVCKMRRKNQPTVPFLLSEDLKTNPFLIASSVQTFTKVRKQKDVFVD